MDRLVWNRDKDHGFMLPRSDFSGPPVLKIGLDEWVARIRCDTGAVEVNEEAGGYNEAARIFWDALQVHGQNHQRRYEALKEVADGLAAALEDSNREVLGDENTDIWLSGVEALERYRELAK